MRPTAPGPPIVSVSGRVDAAVGQAGIGTGLQDDGHVANVGGYVSRLSTACVELASTVVDLEVIACDFARGRPDEHEHDFNGDSSDEDSTVNSDNALSLAAFVKVAIGDFGDVAGNVAAVASTCARRRLFGTAEEENLEFNTDPCSARRLRTVGLVLAAKSETVECRRVRDACCRFVRDILQPTPSASLELALRTIA